jgi:hypothetical protein
LFSKIGALNNKVRFKSKKKFQLTNKTYHISPFRFTLILSLLPLSLDTCYSQLAGNGSLESSRKPHTQKKISELSRTFSFSAHRLLARFYTLHFLLRSKPFNLRSHGADRLCTRLLCGRALAQTPEDPPPTSTSTTKFKQSIL